MKRTAVISANFPKFAQALRGLGFDVISTVCYKGLTENPETAHADMQVLKIENEIFLIKGNEPLNSRVMGAVDKNSRVSFTLSPIYTFKYPECVKLNIAIVGKYAIGNFKYTDPVVLTALKNGDYKLINVNQGYAKCSVSIVSDNAIITSDSSIYSKSSGQTDCLKITEGNIRLCESYGGFIGGASFLADSSTLIFTGDISAHPDYINIKCFCRNHGVYVESLSSCELFDVGGVVIL